MSILLLSTAYAAGSIFVQVGNDEVGRIFVDGVDTQVDAPGMVQVEPGTHLVQVKSECQSGVGSVDVADGKVARLELALEPTGGFAEIRATPDDATATIDGLSLALPAAIELNCGPHNLVVSAAGHNTHTQVIDVKMGGAYRIDVGLTLQGYGSLSVLVDPVDAMVLVDGEMVAVGPFTVDSLSEGEHLVTVRKEGLGENSRTVTVVSGETTQIQLTVGSDIATVTPPKEPRDLSGLGAKVAGGALLAAGIGATGYGSYLRYEGYQLHLAADQDRDGVIDEGRTEFYNNHKDEIVAARRTSVLLWGAGAAALGTGVVLMVNDQGAMVTATVRF